MRIMGHKKIMETLPKNALFDVHRGQTLLFVHAHPDDHEMFTSTAAAQAMAQHINVVVTIATRGEATTLNYQAHNHPHGTPVVTIRDQETKHAFDEQHLPPHNREQYRLPDGRLHTPLNRVRLAINIARTLAKHHISAVITPGEQGMDGHPDHQAIHHSTLMAATMVRLIGRRVAVWAATSGDACDQTIPVNAARKQQLVHIHACQFPKNKPELFDAYSGLLKQEKYMRIR